MKAILARDAEDAWLAGAGDIPPCFGHRARRLAFRAPLIAANHHALLFLLRFAPHRIPPLVVIDELHKLPRAAERVWGDELDEERWYRFAVRVRRLLDKLDQAELEDTARAIAPMVDDVDAAYQTLLRELPQPKDDAIELSQAPLSLAPFHAKVAALSGELEKISHQTAQFAHRELTNFRDTVDRVMRPNPTVARWVDRHSGLRYFHAVPIDTGPVLAPLFASGRGPRIGMSATAAIAGSFAPIERACGIQAARHLVLPPCFNHAQQMRYFVPFPPLDPRPNEQAYLHAAGLCVRELVLASRGRALVLCTAFKQIGRIKDALGGIPYPVLVGDEHAGPLADEFRDDLHSILLGTARYWEGLDVAGPSCSLVIMVRLPFDRPDPLTLARKRAAEARGLHGFWDVLLPEAILWIKQGPVASFGRSRIRAWWRSSMGAS
jgi:ATP-dependent DNA helicase DinG